MAANLLLVWTRTADPGKTFLHRHVNQDVWNVDKCMFLEKTEVCSWTPSLHSRAVLYSLLLFPFPIFKYFLLLYNCRHFLARAGIYILWNMYYTYLGSNHGKALLEGKNAGEVLLTARVSLAGDSPRSHPWSFTGALSLLTLPLQSHCTSYRQPPQSKLL